LEELTVAWRSEGYLEEKKSEFFSFLVPSKSLAEFEGFISELRQKNREMCHFCSAVRLRNPTLVEKASDDGEPSGTAGRPILNVLQRKNLINCGIVVMRKFGGTLLGTGGLTRAYSESAQSCVLSAKMGRMAPFSMMKGTIGYKEWAKVEKLIREYDKSPQTSFGENIQVSFLVRGDKISTVSMLLKEALGGEEPFSPAERRMIFESV